jgi:hypothetical protein
MALAPQLDAADFVSSAEVVTVAIFAQPPSLAGCLTGLLASGLGTIPLPILGAPIGEEELRATTAFASGLRQAHRERYLEAPHSGRKRKRRTEEDQIRRRKKSFRAKCRKKIQPKKTEFQTASFPPLSFRR